MEESNNEPKKKSIFEEEDIETIDFDINNDIPIKEEPPKNSLNQEVLMPPTTENNNNEIKPQEVVSEEIKSNVSVNPIKEDLNKVSTEIKTEVKTEMEEEKPKNETINLLNRPVTDNELLGDYVGTNFYSISQKIFNFSAVIFNSLYLFYRKMLIFGLLIFIVTIIILNYVSNPYFALIPSVLLGFIFNKIYMAKANIKVTKNRLNNKTDTYDLKNKCEKSGGTSLTYVFLGLIIEYGIVLGLIQYDLLHNFTKMINDSGVNINLVENFDKVLTMFNKEKKLEINTDTKVDIVKEIKISIPSVYKKGNENSSYKYHYIYSNNQASENNICYMKLEGISNYEDSYKLLKDISSYYKVSDPTPNKDWYYITYTKDNETLYQYSLKKNEMVYLLTFGSESNSPDDCNIRIKEIYNSIVIN